MYILWSILLKAMLYEYLIYDMNNKALNMAD